MKSIPVVMCIILLAACGGEPDAEGSLEERSFSEVMKQASEDEYTPPEDGKLTDEQVEMYLEVREHEKKIADASREKLEETSRKFEGKEKSIKGFIEGVRGMGNIGDFLTADIRAAQDLGYNTAEYKWIKETIGEAISAEMTRRMMNKARGQFQESREQIRQKMERASGDEREAYERLLESIDENEPAVDEEEMDEAVRHNLGLLASYEDITETLGSEFSRWGADITSEELQEMYGENE